MVAAVVRNERAEQADEADPWAHLVDEPLVVRPRDVEQEAADANPDGGEDGRQEGEDHRPVVPGPAVPLPMDVREEREDDDERGREGPGPDLAGANRHPERKDDCARGQVLRHYFVREKRWTASSSSRLFSAATSASPDSSAPATQWFTCSSRILNATLSSAVVAAAICVRMSMQ